jgi:hypothetical protein
MNATLGPAGPAVDITGQARAAAFMQMRRLCCDLNHSTLTLSWLPWVTVHSSTAYVFDVGIVNVANGHPVRVLDKGDSAIADGVPVEIIQQWKEDWYYQNWCIYPDPSLLKLPQVL